MFTSCSSLVLLRLAEEREITEHLPGFQDTGPVCHMASRLFSVTEEEKGGGGGLDDARGMTPPLKEK